MDDKKKKEVEEIEAGTLALIAAAVIIAFWSAIVDFLNTTFAPVIAYLNLDWNSTLDLLRSVAGIIIGLSFPISLFFIIGIIYCIEQLKRIRRKEEQTFDIKVEPAFEENAPQNPALGHRWENVQSHISSTNPSDWRQAILEADVMLDDILTDLGYQGAGVGEKLKRVNPGDMKSLDEAWEGHKIRNQIAHEGTEFVMDQHEANRVINLYKKVFDEFYLI
jgi:hypothetical protein